MIAPFFSIIVPMYNREQFIDRTLVSCSRQSFDDFEVIVVDDGSQDESVGIARAHSNPRVRLIQHEVNRGVSEARNTGVAVARGQWVICLDSDDELITGALGVIHDRAVEIGGRIDGLRFMCRQDDGELSPDPPLQDEVWGYQEYMMWVESVRRRRAETLVVVRRSTFEKVRYLGGHAREALYHFDFARCFLVRSCPDVVRAYHQDARNQLTKPNRRRWLEQAPERVRELETLISKHGEALSVLAPRVYSDQLLALARCHFLRGRRLPGLRYAGLALRHRSSWSKLVPVVAFGLLSRNVLAWVGEQVARLRVVRSALRISYWRPWSARPQGR